MAEPRTEQEVVEQFQTLLQERDQLTSASIERQQEMAEHDLVIKTLEPLESGRKCFRLVGEVLVERTVGEVLPAVKKNRDNLAAVSDAKAGQGEQRWCCICRSRQWALSCRHRHCCWPEHHGVQPGLCNPLTACTPAPPLQVVSTYEKQLAAKQKEVLAYQDKYNIRIKGDGDGTLPERPAAAGAAQGVLVGS
jgi:prefoldin subunit 2